MLSVKPDIDISAQNEYAFRLACENDKLYVAEWLCTLNDNYHIELDFLERIKKYSIKPNFNYKSIIEMEEENECCVCYEMAILKTSCNHYGCEKCFQKLNNICPYCRQTITEYYKIKS